MYKHVISLGEACDVAHNVRRLLGIETAQFFDWHVTSLEALTAAIAADMVGIGDEIQLRKNRNTAVDLIYGIQLQHAFTRGEDGLVAPETVDRERTTAKQKLRFLRRRWLETLGGGDPILFVMRRQVDQAQVDALHALLDAKTAGPWALLCLHYPNQAGGFIARDGVSHAIVKESPSWEGDAESWNDALADIEYVPPTPRDLAGNAP